VHGRADCAHSVALPPLGNLVPLCTTALSCACHWHTVTFPIKDTPLITDTLFLVLNSTMYFLSVIKGVSLIGNVTVGVTQHVMPEVPCHLVVDGKLCS
jgi:hypothetical protein